ncbi:SCO3374 family protein [Streptomyces sp. H27-C3]|uniref:SCO3374 family protein n=1 Tax=Streptomyces sp. H27-C3 TaxID=3046305 RepID=UPI0024BB3A27|nr:SCO3374 family protein [Streptomyces sp. H27-C3]MDJ0466363.1 SCO3374 family protein [Streptomyces sp. H27-C3]
MTPTVPLPRTPLPLEDADGTARWYEHELGWAVAGGRPVELLTGLRFDVLELPADAGFAVLRRCGAQLGPVALLGQRMRLLVAAGSAEELPGLLDWLEWGGVALALRALGAGGRMTAPAPPGRAGPQGAAVWLRPPEPGHEVEPTLPAFAGLGCRGEAPDLVRLVGTAATECHRARLLRATVHYRGSSPGSAATSQPLAFS